MKPARGRTPRRGMTVVAVLICLIVITVISVALLKVALSQRKLVRGLEHRLQAEWLAESGAERAVARLDADPGYKGEVWSITAADLGQSGAPPAGEPGGARAPAVGLVTIAVDRLPESGNANRRRIRVTAEYPSDPSLRSRSTKQLLHDLERPNSGDSK
jgi:hypothetical protein